MIFGLLAGFVALVALLCGAALVMLATVSAADTPARATSASPRGRVNRCTAVHLLDVMRRRPPGPRAPLILLPCQVVVKQTLPSVAWNNERLRAPACTSARYAS